MVLGRECKERVTFVDESTSMVRLWQEGSARIYIVQAGLAQCISGGAVGEGEGRPGRVVDSKEVEEAWVFLKAG